jgi:hypothetical protein
VSFECAHDRRSAHTELSPNIGDSRLELFDVRQSQADRYGDRVLLQQQHLRIDGLARPPVSKRKPPRFGGDWIGRKHRMKLLQDIGDIAQALSNEARSPSFDRFPQLGGGPCPVLCSAGNVCRLTLTRFVAAKTRSQVDACLAFVFRRRAIRLATV